MESVRPIAFRRLDACRGAFHAAFDDPAGFGTRFLPGPGVAGHSEQDGIPQLATGRVVVLGQLAEFGQVAGVAAVADVVPPDRQQAGRRGVLMADRRHRPDRRRAVATREGR